MASMMRPSTRFVQERIHALVSGNPGIHVRRIAMLTGLSWNTCVYHLRIMERAATVVSRKVQGRICWFDCVGGAVQGKEAVILLRNAENLRVARAVMHDPGRNQLQLARSLGLAASVVHRRVTRLEQAGLILRHRTPRSVHLFPADGLLEAARQVGVDAGMAPSADAVRGSKAASDSTSGSHGPLAAPLRHGPSGGLPEDPGVPADAAT